ncbi:hypothetical protein OE88DRAFT_1651854 [Heliocybe sulcata]|uniref:Uncharacterized protein n=1 Tax=Heliocybe sulcata TaxID=5364 RepID=A0A5C3NEW0_9AGAM|nr:hypothetical protein OE88DRAFT_1651854 [Heliocybe sulcata]
MSSSYATSESAALLWYEQSINAAVYIGAMAYGLHIAVFYHTVLAVARNNSGFTRAWLPYSALLLALATINICCSINFNERAWIDYRNYPGGPLAFFVEQPSIGVNIAAISTSIITILLCDALLIYRCHTLIKNIFITLLLCGVLLAATVMSVLHVVQAARPDAGLFEQSTLKFSIPYASLAMSLNVLLCIILAWRVLDFRRKLSSSVRQHIKDKYIGAEAIMVESALPYGLASFIFMILYGLKSTAANLFVSLLVQLEAIVAELLVMRMASGNALALDIFRPIGPGHITLRGQLGQSDQSVHGRENGDLSMTTLNHRSDPPGNSKVAQDDQV